MYKVERAIIMAAGLGNRLRPLTETTPKPLIKVNGTPMIETVIKALHINQINEIYIVTGYKSDCFNYLAEKYAGITLIYNPLYEVCNNISSLYVAKSYISNSIIIDGDQIINNPDILHKDFDRSGYCALWCEGNTNEWLLQLDENGIVTSCSRTGGAGGWQLFGISRWTNEDGKRLEKHLEEEFVSKDNRQIYWDDVAMFCHFDEYQMGIYEICKDDVVEIDSYEELCSIDNSYQIN